MWPFKKKWKPITDFDYFLMGVYHSQMLKDKYPIPRQPIYPPSQITNGHPLLREAISALSMTANTLIKLKEAKIKRDLMKDIKPKNCFPCIESGIKSFNQSN